MRKKLLLILWMLAAVAAVGSLRAGNARAAGAQSSKGLNLLGSIANATGGRVFLLADFDERFPANDYLSMTVGDSSCAWRCMAQGAAAGAILSSVRTNPSVSSVSIDVNTAQTACTAVLGSTDPSCTLPSAVQMTCNDNRSFVGHGTGTTTNGYPSGPPTVSHLLTITGGADCAGSVGDDSTVWQGSGSIQYEQYVNH